MKPAAAQGLAVAPVVLEPGVVKRSASEPSPIPDSARAQTKRTESRLATVAEVLQAELEEVGRVRNRIEQALVLHRRNGRTIPNSYDHNASAACGLRGSAIRRKTMRRLPIRCTRTTHCGACLRALRGHQYSARNSVGADLAAHLAALCGCRCLDYLAMSEATTSNVDSIGTNQLVNTETDEAQLGLSIR